MKKKGAVGIGTLIIFIAMVLVAAIAAAVLINVSGILQQKAMATGKESIQQVSSNIMISSIKGYTADMRDVANLTILVTASAGAGRIDLRYLIFAIRNDQNDTYLNYTDGAPGTGTFSAEELRDPSNVFTTAAPVVDGSTLVALHILTGANQTPAIHLNSRSKLYLSAIPEHGAAVNIVVQMPESFSTNVIDLYP